jgi:hypothetical protein
MKRRCIKIGKEETPELIQQFARDVEVEGSNMIEKLGIEISQLPVRKALVKPLMKTRS